jgi:eukaryotic-like serine/threonine-protein kinase
MAPKEPAKIGKYDVIDVIGRGGMGVVYEATDPFLNRRVAIKMMTGGFADKPDLLKRFFREAQSTGSLQHPNIVTVFELGDHAGNPYLVMEFLEGESLDAIISSRRQLSILEKIQPIIAVCHGLSHAHRRGIVHRDIKPANIMVSKDGVVKIVDFGIAHIIATKETRTGQIMGSVSYMAPEQVNGQPVDARTDIFSTGVVLYELFTYNHPFDGENMAATLMKIIHAAPPPLKNFVSDYPPELESIIFKALAKNREERYHSADDFALDLSQLQGQLKQQIIGKHLQEVSVLLEKAELLKAKEQLLQALQVDRQNTEANLLLREVQQRIQKAQINEQVQQLRVQAEEAFAHKQFEPALGYLERAVVLHATDVELQRLRESIQTAWSRDLELQERLKRAEWAHQAGDLDSAKQAMEEALQMAPDEVRGATLYRTIQQDWEKRSRQRHLENYLEQARREIAARNFTSALEKLKLAEAVDPGAPQVKTLVESATLGREQEQRRRELERITRQIEEALNRDDYEAACQKADEGLKRFPEERTLSKLKSLAEKQRQVAERKHFVDEQLNFARTLVEQGRNEELLSVLQAALAKTGPEPRLQSLLLMVRENVEHERSERRKAEHLKKAKDALSRKSYDEAIQILQSAHTEVKDSTEIADLLQFSKDEALAEKRRLVVEAAAQEANAFIAEQEYEQAIKLLEATLEETPDEELRIILIHARRASLDHQKKLETTLSTAEKLLQGYRAGEALRLLEAHSSLLARSAAFQTLLETARSEAERLRRIDDLMNRASQALDHEDYPTALGLLQEGRRLHGSTPKLEHLLAEVFEKQSLAAGNVVQKALSDAHALIIAYQYEAALEKLAPASDLVTLASPELQSEYGSLRQQASDGLVDQRIAQFEQHLADGKFTEAERTLHQTLLLFPGNRDLQGRENVLREEVDRRSEAQQALAESQRFFGKADWKRGGELLKKAFAAAERAPAVRQQVLDSFVEAAETALEKDWCASEALLQQLAELQPSQIQPAELQNQIAQRKRQELVNQCWGQAKRLQSAGDLQAALRETERGLSSYADESQLLELRAQIQEQVRQEEERAQLERARLEMENLVRDVTRRAQSEPGLDRRMQILEDGLARYPQEPRLQHQLSQARELSTRVVAIVSEARALEEAKRYEEAVQQWNGLRSVHPQYPELDSNLGRVAKLAEQARAAERAEWIRSTQAALASADYGRAGDLLSLGKKKFPGDRDVSECEKKLQDGLKLRDKAQKIIADGRAALGKKKWEKGAGYLTRACEVAPGDSSVQEQVVAELLEGCEAAVEVDYPSAEMLLARVAEIQPNSPLLSPLRARIENQKRDQTIEQHMTAAVRAQSDGNLPGALSHLQRGLSAYPNEPRLLQVKGDIETRLRQLEAEQEAQRKAEKERARQAELEQQRQLKQKRQEEAERERAKAAEQKEKVARARELEEKAEQERIRQRQAEQQRQQERRQAEERKAQEKAEKKRQLEEQKLAEQTRRRIEALQSADDGGKTIVVVPPNVLTNPRVLVAGGTVVLAVLGAVVWMLMPGAVPVEFKTTPLGTTVRIVSTGEECVTPYCSIKLRAGQHELEFSHKGYETKRQSVAVQSRGSNTFQIALSEKPIVVGPEKPPSGTTTGSPSTTKPPPVAMASMRIRGWSKGSEVFLDNNPIGTIGSGGTFSSITPGKHQIKVVDKKGESGTMQKSFAPGERADLAKKDFALPPPPLTTTQPPPVNAEDRDWQHAVDSGSIAELEQFRAKYPKSQHLGESAAKLDDLYWDKAMGAGTAAGFDEYLAKLPSGKHRSEAQQELAWSKAEASNTIQGFRDYQQQYSQGPHFGAAEKKIEGLKRAEDQNKEIQRFQEARNSGDEAVWQAFLKDYPSGTRHDQIYGRLDDLVWEKTNKNDKTSLQAYVSRMSAGKHVPEANDAIEKLNEAAKPPKQPSRPVVDAKAEVLKVVDRYVKAYNDTSIEELKQIWPGMDKKRVSSMRDFFRIARNVKSKYALLEEPTVNGSEATVKITQDTTFVVEGRQQKQSGTLTLKLKPAPGTSGSWEISSVSEN